MSSQGDPDSKCSTLIYWLDHSLLLVPFMSMSTSTAGVESGVLKAFNDSTNDFLLLFVVILLQFHLIV